MITSGLLNRRTLLGKAAAAALAVPAIAALPPFEAGLVRASDPLKTELDAILQEAVDGGIPGMVLQVERAGKTIYWGAAGVSDVEQATPLKKNDRHRIYSITKTYTALVTLQLVDEGVLSLDDTVTRWLDDPAVTAIPNVDEVNLYHLLTHTSGIYDFADDNDSPFWVDAFLGPNADWTKVWTPAELLAYADGAKHAPYGVPGEKYVYSNTNYILIGLIVERATGNTFGDEFRRRILTPLKLKDTFFVEGATLPPDDTVDAYQFVEGQYLSLSGTNLSWSWTFGNIVSTTADLARFARAVYGGELISPDLFAKMFDFFPAKHEGYYEGIGVYKIDTPSGQIYGSSGTGPGANSILMRLDEADLTLIMIDNVAPDQGATEILTEVVVKTVLAHD